MQMPYMNPEQGNISGSIVQMTNPENEICGLELAFKGLMEDRNGKITKTGDALMNDSGVNSVVSQIKSAVNQITIMSNIAERDVSMIMHLFSDTLIKDLMINKIKYEIKDSGDRSKILTMSQTVVYFCVNRAKLGDDKRFWKGSQQDIRTTIVNSGQKGGGVLAKLNPFSK